MTTEQLEKALGTLILFSREGVFYRGKLIYIFDLPQGFNPRNRCVLVMTPEKKYMVFVKEIWYAWPHFNKKIQKFNQENVKKYASAAKQHGVAKLIGRDTGVY